MQIGELLTAGRRDRIKGLELLARQVVEGFCAGRHRSPHKGYSVEFREHRPYVQGDEIRSIDWKVFGKTDRIYIREFEEETNLKATLIVDASGSMNYGGPKSETTKFQYASVLAASLAYLMIGQQDSVGLATFSTSIREFLPPRSRASHLQAIFASLLKSSPAGDSDIGAVLSGLAGKLHRRGLLILISDCFDDVSSMLHALAQFRHIKHEVLVFQILDPDETDFPFRGRMRFRDLERPAAQEDIDAAAIREAYLQNFRSHQNELRLGCGRHRVDHVVLTTDTPPVDALARYLSFRRRITWTP